VARLGSATTDTGRWDMELSGLVDAADVVRFSVAWRGSVRQAKKNWRGKKMKATKSEISKVMAFLGSKTSARKKRSARANAKLPRPRRKRRRHK